jgi:hypothetical protein
MYNLMSNRMLRDPEGSRNLTEKLAKQGKALMKRPALRVTKWLGDIPVEAACTCCLDMLFKAKASTHRPNREEYQRSIQAQFDAHCEAIHPQSSAP